MSRPLNSRQLEAFRAVMLTGSMTGAGLMISISQPAVSRLIRDLEDDLSLRLFQRQGNQLVATAEARQLYREVERHFAGTERIRDAARTIKESSSGRMHIGVMPTFSVYCVPEAVSRFMRRFPDAVVSVTSDSSVNLVQMLLHGQVDVAFATPPHDLTGFDHEPFPDVHAVCVMPDGHPLGNKAVVSIEDLHGVDFIELGPNSSQRIQLSNAMDAVGVNPRKRVQTLHSSSAMSYVSRGLGVTVIDAIAALGSPNHSVQVRPFKPDIIMRVAALYRQGIPRPRFSDVFADMLKEVVWGQLGGVRMG